MVAGEGFEPSKAEPGDLQSPPIGRSGNPPDIRTVKTLRICYTYLLEVLAKGMLGTLN